MRFTGNTSNVHQNYAYSDWKVIPAADFPQSPTHSELHPQVGRVLSQGQYQQFYTSLGHKRQLNEQNMHRTSTITTLVRIIITRKLESSSIMSIKSNMSTHAQVLYTPKQTSQLQSHAN